MILKFVLFGIDVMLQNLHLCDCICMNLPYLCQRNWAPSVQLRLVEVADPCSSVFEGLLYSKQTATQVTNGPELRHQH